MNKEILLLGCNYNHINYRSIDYTSTVSKIARYIKKKDIIPIEISAIDDTNYDSILLALYKIVLKSWSCNLNTILIYYIGDSIDISEYISGYNSNYDINQGIVPTDYNIRKTNSVINTDMIYEILSQINPSTKVIYISDCCFTKSNILNLRYDWDIENKQLLRLSDSKINDTLKNILVISFCLDKLSSNDDNFYNILDINKNIISLGDYIIKLRNLLDNKNEERLNYDIFSILKDINGIITNKKVNMRVSLSSSYNLLNDIEYLAVLDKQEDILSLSTFEDFVNNSYVEIDKLPTFIDIPLESEDKLKIPKVLKSHIEKKCDFNIPKLNLNKPPILIDQYTKLRTSNGNNDFNSYYNNIDYTPRNSNRCSRSSFIEYPEEHLQQIVPLRPFVAMTPINQVQQVQPLQQFQPLQQVQQFQPLQQVQQSQQFIPHRQIFIESPRIQYTQPIQYKIQNNLFKNNIVPKDTRYNQNKYYEPPSSYIQECYC